MTKQIPNFTPHSKPSTQQGLVISYFGNSVAVQTQDGQVFQCHLRRNQDLAVVGDQVHFILENETGMVTEILPRRSTLARGEMGGKKKPIAANIDAVVIVMAPPPILSEYLIDRYLVATEILGIAPIIVLNKIDLLTNETNEIAKTSLAPYREVPYPVVLSSIYLTDGLQALAEILQDKSVVLVGPSGVGKSSIISALTNEEAIKTREVSDKGIGKHTTTATRLYHLPKGGCLIDSPGVREFNLWPITKEEVLQGFPEFKKVKTACKFRDCLHNVEPGCAVQLAVTDGKISPRRFSSYQEFLKQAVKKNNYE